MSEPMAALGMHCAVSKCYLKQFIIISYGSPGEGGGERVTQAGGSAGHFSTLYAQPGSPRRASTPYGKSCHLAFSHCHSVFLSKCLQEPLPCPLGHVSGSIITNGFIPPHEQRETHVWGDSSSSPVSCRPKSCNVPRKNSFDHHWMGPQLTALLVTSVQL